MRTITNEMIEIHKEIDGETGTKLLSINESRYLNKGYICLHGQILCPQKAGCRKYKTATTFINIKHTQNSTSYTDGKKCGNTDRKHKLQFKVIVGYLLGGRGLGECH